MINSPSFAQPELIDEFRAAPDAVFSFGESTNQTLQTDYTLGPGPGKPGDWRSEAPVHQNLVKSRLIRNLDELWDDAVDELSASFVKEFASVPTATSGPFSVFYTVNNSYVCRWIGGVDRALASSKYRTHRFPHIQSPGCRAASLSQGGLRRLQCALHGKCDGVFYHPQNVPVFHAWTHRQLVDANSTSKSRSQ